ncbi:E3 ubiquitin/ISG15 ligase TRIM25-like [Xyrauchen texanus]|uniref:E3 ubiquitin/ISG15 ligase TRIM25-like n=1 Tax=Xyrauchen texanus TaxID=154827 RepID=UPI0022429237|nr:E3 ubiquitin/ISG15 ligase TRIM25-like [Xyrauchen texanus]
MAGSSSDAQNPLNCPICLDMFKDPVTTSCGHSFCKGCINEYWNREFTQRGIYNCPNCRKTFSHKPNLSKSTVLAELLEEINNVPQAGPKDVKCDFCKGRILKASKSCLVCLASYCKVHLQPHYESDAFKKHNLVKAFPQLNQQICSQHHKALEIYCADDNRCICVLCLGDHIGHRTFAAADEMAKKQEELKSIRISSKQKIKDIEKNVQELKKAVDSHKRSAQAAVEHSEQIFKELINSIRKTKTEVRSLIRAQEKKEVEQVENHIRSLEQQIGSLQKDNDLLEKVLHTDDRIYFFQNYSSISELMLSPSTVPKAVNELPTFENVKKSFSELKIQLNQVLQEHTVNISRIVAEVQIFTSHFQKATMSPMYESVYSSDSESLDVLFG